MSYFQHEGAQETSKDHINVDFLLPTGILIPLPCKPSQKLEDIKELLWRRAKDFPLFGLLRGREWYTLVFVNPKAEQEACHNEEKTLLEISYYKPLFKVVEKKEDGEEKLFGNRLGIVIDKSLKEFESVRDPEVNDFRLSMIDRCQAAVEIRNQATWEQKVMYLYPPDVESTGDISSLVQDKLNPQNQFFVHVFAMTPDKKEHRFLLPAQPRDTPAGLLDIALKRFNRAQGIEEHSPDDYVLKVCGYEEYLLGEFPLIKYRCINRMIGKGSQPTLSLVSKASIRTDYPLEKYIPPNLARRDKPKNKDVDVVSLWSVEEKLEIKVDSAANLNVGKDASIMVIACVYHGDESLCADGQTRAMHLDGGDTSGIWRWNENIVFDIPVCDVPRGARLCLAIYAVYGNKKTKKKTGKLEAKGEKVPLAWVNQPLFDYRNYLRTGAVSLPCWPMSPEDTMEGLLNPIDTVMLNPNTQDSPSIKIKFKDYVDPP
jgi:phosphatidylinositol-4,5-bisphosphate 3-kinase